MGNYVKALIFKRGERAEATVARVVPTVRVGQTPARESEKTFDFWKFSAKCTIRKYNTNQMIINTTFVVVGGAKR